MINEKFLIDYKKITGKEWSLWEGSIKLIISRPLRYIFLGRKLEFARNIFSRKIYSIMMKHHQNKYGMSLNFDNIGKGVALGYANNITVNGGVKIGEDCSIFKGVLIGSVRSGSRMGVPRIGNRVVICSNAVIVGNVTIGNDVLIAANAFVDFDVPDHSIVIGNPGVIKRKENASKDYIMSD